MAYSLFNFIRRIFDILKTTTGRTLHLRLKIDFDTDLMPNITRHSCIMSTELVVSSFIKTTLRHFFTLWLFILTFPAFSTPAKLVPHFHVLHFPLLQVGPAFSCPAISTHANWCRKFMSRIFKSCIFDHPVFSCLAFSVAPIIHEVMCRPLYIGKMRM